MLPPFCRTHGDHDDKASGLKIVDRKSTDLSFGTAIPNHSGPTRRIVLSAAYSICFELRGSGRSVLMDSNRRLSAMSFVRSKPSHQSICDKPVGFDGRRRSPHSDGRSIQS